MDKTTIQEIKYIKDYINSHKEEETRDLSKFNELTRMFVDPIGTTKQRLKMRLDEIMTQLAKEERLDNAYLDMAESLSTLSYAERAKVGCLIVKNGQIVSQGYNGTPTGFDNCCEEGNVTKREVLHAESNAISKCAKWGGSTDGATLYVTMSPCFECAKLIIQAGIHRVVYKELYRDATGIELLERAGIEVNRYENRKQVYET